jgi:hypothetical protein
VKEWEVQRPGRGIHWLGGFIMRLSQYEDLDGVWEGFICVRACVHNLRPRVLLESLFASDSICVVFVRRRAGVQGSEKTSIV